MSARPRRSAAKRDGRTRDVHSAIVRDRLAFMGPILERIAPRLGAEVLVEPEFGFVGLLRFPSGRQSYFWNNVFNLNSVSAARIARDKGYTAYFLRQHGYRVPESRTFFRESFRRHLGAGRGLPEALVYARGLGWPVFVKPVRRSQGEGVAMASDAGELERIARAIFAHDRLLMVERACRGRDYRLVVLDGEVISAYERVPLTVTGDGRSSIAELLQAMQRRFVREGRDTQIPFDDYRMRMAMARQKLRRASVLARGREVRLFDAANLSLGGTMIEVTRRLHPSFRKLAARVASDMDLRFLGLDLIAEDATAPLGDYAILEINAAPGLDHYGGIGAGHEARIDALYTRVLEAIARGPRRVVARKRSR